jgi:peptide subunit release factor 1 (eRF1)
MGLANSLRMPSTEPLTTQLDRVASADTGPFPFISLYLNLQTNEQGRPQFEPFLRKELADRVRTYQATGPERESLDQDAAKIRDYVAGIDSSTANGLALFACHAADLFEAIELSAPIDAHRLFVSDQPHLYPLARVLDEYPRYVAVLTDTHSARIFVFATNSVEKTEQIEGTKTKHHKKGGWSQARYQRHVENFHQQHAKEVVDAVAKIVRDEAIDKIVVAGDEVIVPLLREELPKDISERIVDVLKLDIRAPEREVLESTIAALRNKDAEADRERVEELIGAYRANGLACVGVEDTRRAFEMGQVDELLITAAADGIAVKSGQATETGKAEGSAAERAADELILLARTTSARIRFIEDPSLLQAVGGVGAFLRFRI